MNPPTNPQEELRNILGCICASRGDYDGKSYNLKTEQWESCSCVWQLKQLQAISKSHSLALISRIEEEVIGEADTDPYDKTPFGEGWQNGRTTLRNQQRTSLNRIKETL